MSVPEAVAIAVWCFLVALAGGVVGLVLGNLRLPVVLLVASSPATGGAANIAISGVAATAASVGHVRAGRINWRLFRWMAPPSVVGALAGGYLAGEISDELLLFVIAAVLLYSGADLLRWERPAAPAAGTEPHRLDIRAAVLAGLGIGLLGGLVGLILGALRMPALLKLVGEVPSRAVGTNLTVGVLVGVAGLVGHLPDAAPDWDLLALGAAASIPGAVLGARLTGRLSERQLVRAIGAALLVAGTAALVQALT
ncbi:MAG: sulfite exporter TauE/SafE family protein [Thermoleophilaceae bacterium]|nr:sulfite exporter TauE/SafE family protein [Thermoleophilaceae bacterium]